MKGGIKSWPELERPRERLFKYGEALLSDAELIAILLGNGVRGESAIDLARKILKKFKSFRNLASADMREWGELKGVGKAKIAAVKAAIEIGKRFNEEGVLAEGGKIKFSGDIAKLLMPRLRDLKKEVFKAIFLDAQNRLIDIYDVADGTVDRAYPIIREILEEALRKCAVSVVCVHNHPSGAPMPSKNDIDFTKRLSDAAKVLDIRFLDHIIIGNNKYYSFTDDRECQLRGTRRG